MSFLRDENTGHLIGIEQAPARPASPLVAEYPKWVAVEKSHIVTREVEGSPPVVTGVPGFEHYHVNRGDGAVTVLVANKDEEGRATAARQDQTELPPRADAATRLAVHTDVERAKADQAAIAAREAADHQDKLEHEEALRRATAAAELEAANREAAAKLAAEALERASKLAATPGVPAARVDAPYFGNFPGSRIEASQHLSETSGIAPGTLPTGQPREDRDAADKAAREVARAENTGPEHQPYPVSPAVTGTPVETSDAERARAERDRISKAEQDAAAGSTGSARDTSDRAGRADRPTDATGATDAGRAERDRLSIAEQDAARGVPNSDRRTQADRDAAARAARGTEKV